jgi:hypothetical protein
MILLSAKAISTPAIARQIGCSERTVRKWRARFAQHSTMASLRDRARSGRPPRVQVETRCKLVKLACSRPSPTTTHRSTRSGHIQRFAMRCRNQPAFDSAAAKLGAFCGLRTFDRTGCGFGFTVRIRNFETRSGGFASCIAARLGTTVLCIDEKTCIQALTRKHPIVYPQPGSPGRFEFEYKRHGTMALLAAFDVRCGKLFGQCRRRRLPKT